MHCSPGFTFTAIGIPACTAPSDYVLKVRFSIPSLSENILRGSGGAKPPFGACAKRAWVFHSGGKNEFTRATPELAGCKRRSSKIEASACGKPRPVCEGSAFRTGRWPVAQSRRLALEIRRRGRASSDRSLTRSGIALCQPEGSGFLRFIPSPIKLLSGRASPAADRQCSADIWNDILRIGSKIKSYQGSKNFSARFLVLRGCSTYERILCVVTLRSENFFAQQAGAFGIPDTLSFLSGVLGHQAKISMSRKEMP